MFSPNEQGLPPIACQSPMRTIPIRAPRNAVPNNTRLSSFRALVTSLEVGINKHSDRHTDRQTDRQAYRQTDRQTDRQTHTQTHRATTLTLCTACEGYISRQTVYTPPYLHVQTKPRTSSEFKAVHSLYDTGQNEDNRHTHEKV